MRNKLIAVVLFLSIDVANASNVGYIPPSINLAGSVNNWGWLSQTFTANSTGVLSSVDLLLTTDEFVTENLYVAVGPTSGGVPSGDWFATLTLDPKKLTTDYPSFPYKYSHFDLSNFHIGVTDGQKYAITLYRLNFDGHSVGWYGSTNNPDLTMTAFEANYDVNQHMEDIFVTPLSSVQNTGWTAVFPMPNSSFGFNATIAPVPEPETYAMMLAGLGFLGCIAMRKKHRAP
jgi:hypothetical protein